MRFYAAGLTVWPFSSQLRLRDDWVSRDGVIAGGWEVAHAAAAKSQGTEAAFSDDEFEPLALQFGNSETPQNGTAASSPSNQKVRQILRPANLSAAFSTQARSPMLSLPIWQW